MLISIIVPVYNAENFLHICIESVVGQSYKEIELILIDDGSTDNSKTICEQHALTDKRVKVFSQKNQGPAAARNSGVRHAQGEYIFFLDADDFIDKNSLEILIEAASQYQPDLVMGNFSKLENDGQTIPQTVSFKIGAEPFARQLKKLSQTDINNYLRHFLRYPSNHLISYCWARLYKSSIIKDNHIDAAGSIEKAVIRTREFLAASDFGVRFGRDGQRGAVGSWHLTGDDGYEIDDQIEDGDDRQERHGQQRNDGQGRAGGRENDQYADQ